MAWRAVCPAEEEGGVWSVRGLDEGVEEDGVGAGTGGWWEVWSEWAEREREWGALK